MVLQNFISVCMSGALCLTIGEFLAKTYFDIIHKFSRKQQNCKAGTLTVWKVICYHTVLFHLIILFNHLDKYCSFCSLVIFYPATAPALAALLADIAWGSIQDFYCLSRIYWILWTMYHTVAPKVFCCHMAIPFSEVLHLSLLHFVQSLGSVHLKILKCLSRFFFFN